jgi:hypothetical protein
MSNQMAGTHLPPRVSLVLFSFRPCPLVLCALCVDAFLEIER